MSQNNSQLPAAPANQLPEGGFLSTLQTHRYGHMLADCESEMSKVVEHVRATGVKGELIIKLKVSPNSKGNTDILKIEDDVAIKISDKKGGVSIYYADDGGKLRRNDPKQMVHPALVVVATEVPPPIRQVSSS